jgi:hypothetical protein
MKVSSHFQAQAISPQEKFLVPNYKETGWGQAAGPNTFEKIEIICPCQEMSHNTSVIHIIVLSLYALWYHTYNLPLFITSNTMTGLCTFTPKIESLLLCYYSKWAACKY